MASTFINSSAISFCILACLATSVPCVFADEGKLIEKAARFVKSGNYAAAKQLDDELITKLNEQFTKLSDKNANSAQLAQLRLKLGLALSDRAQCEIKLKQPEEALKDLNEAVKYDTSAKHIRAGVYESLGRFGEAAADYQSGEKYEQMTLKAATANFDKGLYLRAIKELTPAIDNCKNETFKSKLLFLRAKAYAKKGMDVPAQTDLKAATAIDPKLSTQPFDKTPVAKGKIITITTVQTLPDDLGMDTYITDLSDKLKRAWAPPKSDPSHLTVIFKISTGGQTSKVHLEQKTDCADCDKAALKAIEMASPYRPLPESIKYVSDFDGWVEFKCQFDNVN